MHSRKSFPEREGSRKPQNQGSAPRKDFYIDPKHNFALHKPRPTIRYKVIIYDTFGVARNDKATILRIAQECDQLNLVIREEGNMEDPDLLGIHPKVKVFAGAAWALIHERRLAEGWFDDPHECPRV